MTLPDVAPHLIVHHDYPDEVGVAITLPDGNALYLTTEEADELVELIYDAQATDPALLHEGTDR